MRNILFILFVFLWIVSCNVSKGVDTKNMVSEVIDSIPNLDKNIRGVDFYAYGNNPVWSLEIDFDQYVKVLCEGMKQEIVIHVVKIEEKGDSLSVNYEIENDKADVYIQIQRNENASADDKPYLVDVKVKDKKEDVEREYKGFGQYYGDIRLHCDWKFEKLDGVEVPLSKNGSLIKINIYLDKNKVAGFLGCNNFAANIYFGREQIFFSQIVRTKMACLDDNIEDMLMDVINQKKFKYMIEGDRLFLRNEQHELILKKAN